MGCHISALFITGQATVKMINDQLAFQRNVYIAPAKT